MKDEPALQLSPVSGKYLQAEEPYGVDLASAEAEIRHVFGDTPIAEASIGAAPPDILVKLSGYFRSVRAPPARRLIVY